MDAWAAVRRPWRSLAYLVTTVLMGPAAFVLLVLALPLGRVTVVLLGAIERSRLRLVQPRATMPVGLRARVRAARRLPVPWPEVGYAVLLAAGLWLADLLVLLCLVVPGVFLLAPWLSTLGPMQVSAWTVDPGGEAWLASALGLALAAVAAYAVTLVAAGQSRLARALLDSREAELAAAVADLRRSRVDLVGAFETERRRIERDLHDGVQQRLVALTMTLGRAELDVPDGPGLDAVRDAHRQAEAALDELRGTLRGIHPRVLVDHGLTAAVHELADRAAVPVAVDVALDVRLPAPVEQAAYFVVSEALTNVARHSGAHRAAVRGWRERATFVLTVDDDGTGGAQPRDGGGLAGLGVRLDALGGALRVASPAGGPTQVRMEVPL